MPSSSVKSTRPVKPLESMPTNTWPPTTATSSPLAVAVLSVKADVPLAVITALILMSLAAVSVNLLALHDTASLTLTSPDPPAVPPLDKIVISPPPKFDDSAAPDILLRSPLMASPILKSAGSINQVPLLPSVAKVITFTESSIFTCDALVSIKPPLPPSGAEASSVPPTLTVPDVMPPSSMMPPSLCSKVRALITPVLLTMLASTEFLAPALMMTCPPSAWISPPFSARLFNTLLSTCI